MKPDYLKEQERLAASNLKTAERMPKVTPDQFMKQMDRLKASEHQNRGRL